MYVAKRRNNEAGDEIVQSIKRGSKKVSYGRMDPKISNEKKIKTIKIFRFSTFQVIFPGN